SLALCLREQIQLFDTENSTCFRLQCDEPFGIFIHIVQQIEVLSRLHSLRQCFGSVALLQHKGDLFLTEHIAVGRRIDLKDQSLNVIDTIKPCFLYRIIHKTSPTNTQSVVLNSTVTNPSSIVMNSFFCVYSKP